MYAPVHQPQAVGFFWVPAAGEAYPTCDGGETASNDSSHCCGLSTWTNATYKALKGPGSWTYYNDQRVRAALDLLVLPPPGETLSSLELEAYDKGSSLDSLMVFRLKNARKNFNLIFPASRWSLNKNCIPSDCQSDGYYACWEAHTRAWTEAQLRVFEALTGAKLGATARNAMKRAEKVAWLPDTPWAKWTQRAVALTDTVPGSEPGHRVTTVPTIDNLVFSSWGKILPVPWLKDFINVFSPLVIPIVKAPAPTAPSTRLATLLGRRRPMVAMPAPEGEEAAGPGMGRGAKVALGVGAVALVGLGAYAFTRRRKRR